MCKSKRLNNLGFTLIEVIISLAFFGLLMGAVYSTFGIIGDQVAKTSTENLLSDKGQRILAFMEEDLRMIGHLLPTEAQIPICTTNTPPGSASTNSNLITFQKGTVPSNAKDPGPYDKFTFITSEPVRIKENTTSCMTGQKDAAGTIRSDYYLSTIGTNQRCSNDDTINCNDDTACGAGTCQILAKVEVDAGSTCYEDEIAAVSGSANGRSFVTFEFADKVFYSLKSIGNILTVNESPDRRIQDNATVYSVRQYSYQVDTTGGKRNLRRIGWDTDCATAGDMISNLITTADTANKAGGVDALQFEFTSYDQNATTASQLINTTKAVPEPSNLRYIKIWLLLRADKADKNYINTDTYTLGTTTSGYYADGSTPIIKGPYNDSYRRVLVSKIVEVRNLAPISH